MRQYVHPRFLDLRGIALTQDGDTLFVLTGDGIDVFDPIRLNEAADGP